MPTRLPIPELPGLPLLGCLPRMRRDPLGLLAEAAGLGEQAEAPMVRIRLGRRWVYLLCRPSAVDHVMREGWKNYRKSRKNQIYARVLGQSVLIAEGDDWRPKRQRVGQVFEPTAFAGDVNTATHGAVDAVLAGWRRSRSAIIDVEPDLLRLTTTVIGRALFGTTFSPADLVTVGRAVATCSRYVHSRWLIDLPLWLPTPLNVRFRRARAELRGLVERIIDFARTNPSALMDRLFKAESGDGRGRLSQEELRDEVITMFLAGHETTAAALSWVLYALAAHPEVVQAIRMEVGRVAQGRRIVHEHVPELRTLGAAINEAMRLYPPVWVLTRVARENDTLCGHVVPAGTTVLISPFVLHRLKSVWGQDAADFRPDRFTRVPMPGGAFIPFGLGPRGCVAEEMARTEMMIAVGEILRHCELELPQGSVAPAFRPQASLRHDPPLRLRVGFHDGGGP